MMNLKWDEKYNIGHPRIDHEHQVFLDLIRNTYLAAERREPEDKVLRLLTEVRKYADFHFYSEENIMLDCAYPDYEEHRLEHRRLLASLDDKLHRRRIGVMDLHEVVEFLFNLFALHTTGSDKKIARYIGHRG
jgi:hemerythrin